MKIFDRYIIKKFLGTFFYTVLLFTMVSTVIDFSEKAEKLMDEPVSWWQIITEYYLNFIPYINNLLWPIFVLIAVIFFTSRLARNSEIISIFNAGVSFRRLMVPYLISALFIMTLQLIGAHYVVPIANKTKFAFENKYIFKGNDQGKNRDVHLSIDADTQAYIRYYSKRDTTARDVRIEKYIDNRMKEVISAQRMKWVRPPHQWKLYDYTIHRYSGTEEELIVKEDQSKEISIKIRPDDFIQYVNQKDWLTTPELREFIREERKKGRANTEVYETELHRRTADAISIVILTLIGMTLASRKVRGGMGLHLAAGVIIGAVYVFLSKMSITFAVSDVISPSVAVWIPNIVFGIITIYLIAKAQK